MQFGNEIGCAIFDITPFFKGTGGKTPVERISGSLAFGGLVRFVIVTAKLTTEQQAGGSRIICRSKSNIGPDQGGFRYDLRQSVLDDHPDISASTVAWGKLMEGSARELLSLAEESQGPASMREDMPQDRWLYDYLPHKAAPATQCMEEALAAGFARKKQIRDARERLRVVSSKTGF